MSSSATCTVPTPVPFISTKSKYRYLNEKSTIVTIILIAAAVVLGVIFISWYLRKATPLYIQGTVECTTYKASSKVPGRIEEMKVEEGQHVTKGELLYTLSTPN